MSSTCFLQLTVCTVQFLILQGWFRAKRGARPHGSLIGVISKVSQPTPWCAGMVVVPKSSGALRICVDLKPLNESVLRETYPIPAVSYSLAHLTGACKFSNANSGFWQIPLAPETRLLTTFLTPFGRYCFNKLPFGIASAPEVFQRRMSKILDGLEGILCHMDDLFSCLVVKSSREECPRSLMVSKGSCVTWTMFSCLVVTKRNMTNA